MIVFTDLDGCLLEEQTYDHTPAIPALERLRHDGIPLVLCTSKTIAEVETLAARLDHTGPWIVENGGAIVLPHGHALSAANGGLRGSTTVVTLGAPASDLTRTLAHLAHDVGIVVEGLSTMTNERVAELTGLDLVSATRARARQYSEPFLTDATPSQLAALERMAAAAGARVTKGGRFFHFTGDTDKGVAVRWLLERDAAARDGRVTSLGLGDAPNDLPLLLAVDRPVVIPRPNGLPHPGLAAALPDAECAPRPGPVGWSAAVTVVLDGGRLPPVRSAQAGSRSRS